MRRIAEHHPQTDGFVAVTDAFKAITHRSADTLDPRVSFRL